MKLYCDSETNPFDVRSEICMADKPFYVVLAGQCVMPMWYEGQRAFGTTRGPTTCG